MPIPGDNGNPRAEMDRQEERINEVCEHGANVAQELRVIGEPKKERNIFGEM